MGTQKNKDKDVAKKKELEDMECLEDFVDAMDALRDLEIRIEAVEYTAGIIWASIWVFVVMVVLMFFGVHAPNWLVNIDVLVGVVGGMFFYMASKDLVKTVKRIFEREDD